MNYFKLKLIFIKDINMEEQYTQPPTGFGFNNQDENFVGVAKEINSNIAGEYDSVRNSQDRKKIKVLTSPS